MKSKHVLLFPVVIGIFTLVGCAATQELTTKVKSKVSSLTSAVDPDLVNQVPADKREGFARAEFDLKVTEAKVNLARLKAEQSALQKNCVDDEEDMADSFYREAEIDYDLVKIEAIIKAGLGKKEDNIKIKADLQSKKMKAQAERIKIQADIDIARGKIDDLAKQINKADEDLKAMKFTAQPQ